MMRKKNNNMRRGGGGGHGGNRRFHGGGGGGGNRNDGQNIARQKHHATQMREKYTNMARDAQNNGDRVDVEYYLQHVDHYNRVLSDIAAIEAERFASQREAQQAQAPAEGGEGGNDAGDGSAADAAEPVNPGNQPRMTRGQRHAQQPRPQPAETQPAPADDAGEIPLPGAALPAI